MTKIIKSAEWGEFKVLFLDGSTYYTPDLDDAKATIKDTTGEDVTKITRATTKQNENW